MCHIDSFSKNPRLKKTPKCLVNKSLPHSLQTTVPSGKLPILTSPMFPNYKIVRRKSRSSAKKLFVLACGSCSTSNVYEPLLLERMSELHASFHSSFSHNPSP